MRLLFFFLVLNLPRSLFAQVTLLPAGSAWRFFDQGSAPIGWNLPTFDDSQWAQGNAELGYGEGDETTVVGFGPSPANKYMTTYFRTEFSVIDPTIFAYITASLIRDDGAIVYLNGTEVWRSNLPEGNISFTTPAINTVAWPFENDWFTHDFSAMFIETGTNILAVEIHQDEPSSSDISFNLSLSGNTAQNAVITRGPYLQKATENSIIVRWRTDVPTDSKVKFGAVSGSLTNEVIHTELKKDHAVELTGLTVNSLYYYSIGSNNSILLEGNNLFFETLPTALDLTKNTFLVLGDAGTGYQDQLDVKNAIINYSGTSHFDGVLLLGDNAYDSGFDNEYQNKFFGNKYNEIFENTVIWPAPGNHDYNNHIPFSPSPAYFDIFNCPTNGESGGVPSGTEKYYSFNHGNIHFVSLDSYDVSRSVTGEMATWLTQDLAANQLPWIVTYFHHPPYTKGSHDSDNALFLDGELVDMRENIVPILENYGVDLVLNGHSHSYERSVLIDGHYGLSSTFGPQHVKDGGSGSYPVDCPYEKHTYETGVGHQGAVYAVVGCSGKISAGQSDWPHPAMYSYTFEKAGAMLLSIEDNRLDAVFVTAQGEEFDRFTIVKNAGFTEQVSVCPNDLVNLNASWPQDVVWSIGGNQNDSISLTAVSDMIVTASDPLNCIQDTFQIDVLDVSPCDVTTIDEFLKEGVSPKLNYSDGILTIQSELNLDFVIYTINGQEVFSFDVESGSHSENISFIEHGVYLIWIKQLNKTIKIYFYD